MSVHTISQKYFETTNPALLTFIDEAIEKSFNDGDAGNFRFDANDSEAQQFDFTWLSCTVVDDETAIINFTMNVEDVHFEFIYKP